jgi:hypothetical protein
VGGGKVGKVGISERKEEEEEEEEEQGGFVEKGGGVRWGVLHSRTQCRQHVARLLQCPAAHELGPEPWHAPGRGNMHVQGWKCVCVVCVCVRVCVRVCVCAEKNYMTYIMRENLHESGAGCKSDWDRMCIARTK